MEFAKEEQEKRKKKTEVVLRSTARDAKSMVDGKVMAARAPKKQVHQKQKRKTWTSFQKDKMKTINRALSKALLDITTNDKPKNNNKTKLNH